MSTAVSKRSRLPRISWQEYFMGIAFLSGKRCKDQHYMVGACIVNNKNIIIGTGYNKLPKGSTKSEKGKTSHAEHIAIRNTNSRSTEGCTMYVTLFPCNRCAVAIIQAGIKKVIYLCDNYVDRVIAAKHMFTTSGVTYMPYESIMYRVPLHRYGYLQIDVAEYCMGIAYLSARRSKDVVCNIGACIVNKDNVIVGIGYNGLPRGMDDIPKIFLYNQYNQYNQSKDGYFKECHAELNAILNKNVDADNLQDCTMYVTSYPCTECAKKIIDYNITKLVYMSNKQNNVDMTVAKELLEAAGVSVSEYNPPKERIEIYET
ncbi:deoxycytidylate deaminase-like [Pseudomyrmex gracilis]|uniref:deoxycytidylate deaminase-like n=1 Tax=Pseudomyrmex gracilis TaxID=219809 RepID=UPI0009955B6C|nr:deoxycytidylate deaminase-like [Pseudomyrmex gracilis]